MSTSGEEEFFDCPTAEAFPTAEAEALEKDVVSRLSLDPQSPQSLGQTADRLWQDVVNGTAPQPTTSGASDLEADPADPYFVDDAYLGDLEAAMTAEERDTAHADALHIKRNANTCFGEASFEDAVRGYTDALRTCPPSFTEDRAVLFANRAAAFMKMEAYKKGVADCDRAIELKPDYVKAYHRRATCHQQDESSYEAALVDWEKVLELEDGRCEAATKAKATLGHLINARNEKLKTEMMGKLKGLGDMVLRPFGMSTNNFELVEQPGGGYSIRTKNA